jgi:hypothetical protein
MSHGPMPAEVQMAIGRIFSLLSRPTQIGDVEQYEAARRVVLAHADDVVAEWVPDAARDRFHHRGAQGQW